jgi:excisionase family DNA binding protein
MTSLKPRSGIDLLLTVTDVAEVLRLSVRSVRRLIAEKKLRVVRIGHAVRVRPEDLQSFIEAAARIGQEMTEDDQ